MLSICGYNAVSDINCLDIFPQSINNISKVELTNGIYNHYNLTEDININYNTDIPTLWDFLTLMDADFNNNINAGNVDFLLNIVTSIRIKRRIKGEFDWVTLKTYKVSEIADLTIAFNDYLNRGFVEYEYAYVPVLNDTEGNYITNSVISKFNGVFICEQDEIYKLYADTSYGGMEQVREVGSFNVFGSKYPVIVSNGLINYKKSSISGKVMPTNFMNNGILDRVDMVKNRDILLNYLTNDNCKIIKDWNGNFWLVMFTDAPNVDFASEYGMGVMDIQANWEEVGDPNLQEDLVKCGIIE